MVCAICLAVYSNYLRSKFYRAYGFSDVAGDVQPHRSDTSSQNLDEKLSPSAVEAPKTDIFGSMTRGCSAGL